MPKAAFRAPQVWTAEELEEASAAALELFIRERIEEGTEAYEALFNELEPRVGELFDVTADLGDINGPVFEANRGLLEVARYIGGPPVSADDLRTLVNDGLSTRKLSAEVAKRVAATLSEARDPIRFPWIGEGRVPLPEERIAAIRWTTGLLAVEKLRTQRRTESSRRQEQAVAATLEAAEYAQVPRPAANVVTVDALERGTFTREIQLAGSKTDLLVRIHDGRLLAMECKVSNSAINSVKRLVRETGGKARAWREAFGQQVVTCAVLAGVFRLGNLLDAQTNYGVFLVWEKDLGPLAAFVQPDP